MMIDFIIAQGPLSPEFNRSLMTTLVSTAASDTICSCSVISPLLLTWLFVNAAIGTWQSWSLTSYRASTEFTQS